MEAGREHDDDVTFREIGFGDDDTHTGLTGAEADIEQEPAKMTVGLEHFALNLLIWEGAERAAATRTCARVIFDRTEAEWCVHLFDPVKERLAVSWHNDIGMFEWNGHLSALW